MVHRAAGVPARPLKLGGINPDTAPSGGKQAAAVSEEPLYRAMDEWLTRNPVDVIHDWSFQNLYVQRHPENFPFLISTCIPPALGYMRNNLVACSQAHAKLCGGNTKHVYYGLNLQDYRFKTQKKEHFIHISKIAGYKAQHLAVFSALRAGKRLVVAGNIESHFYHNTVIRPLLLLPGIQYIGEIQGTNRHLMDASALIQTPRWFDAYPLVILESFASGTPVIAFAEGGIPEQIVDGVNGFLCKSVRDLVHAMRNISEVSPERCREYAEEHHSSERMGRDYLLLYERVLNGESWSS